MFLLIFRYVKSINFCLLMIEIAMVLCLYFGEVGDCKVVSMDSDDIQ